MSPTHTMSAHLCKQMFSAWRHDHKSGSISPEPHASGLSPLPSPTNSSVYSNGSTSYFQRSTSMDSERSSSGSWRWNNKESSR
ncbi:hypothetical protein B0T20DRAFT_343381 [Sordaria brevicollis]|uniref:Uncharacterized protein n=1 Tax=Sordaria brevicollis TaxID=83679 RepID=A0AAE0PNU5_SORBR|nr:hypothetical protein B0T20DRAFT_343381 [Sordaria brevicollis]